MTPVLILAQLADAITFGFMVDRYGIAAEANPIVAALSPSPIEAVLLKVALLAFVLGVASITSRRVSRGLVLFGAVVGVIGAASNVMVLA